MQQVTAPNEYVVARPGMCLQFTQFVFSAPVKFDSATQAWQNQKGRHLRDLPPVGLAVPIWFSHYGTYGPMGNTPRHFGDWGHTCARLADGRIISSPGSGGAGREVFSSIAAVERYFNATYQGWSEYMNGKQVVAASGGKRNEDTMPSMMRIDNATRDIVCVDHGAKTFWNVGRAFAPGLVQTRIDWLKAQGVPYLGGLQPAALLSGYREIDVEKPVTVISGAISDADVARVAKAVNDMASERLKG